jgi:antitoxin component of MazEF toxin-antitoxin module
MPSQTLKVVRIGNSRGVRLPAQLLAHYRIQDSVVVERTEAGILLRPRRDGRLSWEDTFKAMHRETLAKGDEFADMDATAGDGLQTLDR